MAIMLEVPYMFWIRFEILMMTLGNYIYDYVGNSCSAWRSVKDCQFSTFQFSFVFLFFHSFFFSFSHFGFYSSSYFVFIYCVFTLTFIAVCMSVLDLVQIIKLGLMGLIYSGPNPRVIGKVKTDLFFFIFSFLFFFFFPLCAVLFSGNLDVCVFLQQECVISKRQK